MLSVVLLYLLALTLIVGVHAFCGRQGNNGPNYHLISNIVDVRDFWSGGKMLRLLAYNSCLCKFWMAFYRAKWLYVTSKCLWLQMLEYDFRYALPLGFYHAALNLGVSTGLIFPWGRGFLDRPSSLPDRFFIGGNTSPVCSLGGPSSVLGFKCRGLGPTEPRRQSRDQPDGDSSAASERDALGGDLAVSAFADLSFDLPLKVLKEAGIHGHIFASMGNLVKLTENEWQKFSTKSFMQSVRSSVGCGVIVPTKLFRLEVNYCHIMRQFEHDHGKTGVQFSFSSPL